MRILPTRRVIFLFHFLLLTGIGASGCAESSTVSTDGHSRPDTRRPLISQNTDLPWRETINTLRKSNDASSCRSALFRLNNEIGNRQLSDRPLPTSEGRLASLRETVELSDSDREELESSSFTSLDGAYLAECLYLRDVKRVLEVEGQPPAVRARAAFGWVCRHVILDPWAPAALPPSLVLLRGGGSALERAYVCLALLQQLGVDACLIGPANAENLPSLAAPQTWPAAAPPPGPFWAVGARDGENILLFNPWTGETLHHHLSEVISSPGKALIEFQHPQYPRTVTEESLRGATVYLTVPLSGLSERMAWLEKKVGPELDLKLAVDPFYLQQRFERENRVQPRFWKPKNDLFAYSHTLAINAREDGGDWEKKLLTTRIPPIRPDLIPELANAPTPLIDRVIHVARNEFISRFLIPPTPLQRIQRGEFQEAARMLVEIQDHFQRGLELARSDRSELLKWLQEAKMLFQRYEQERLEQNSTGQAEILAEIDKHGKSGGNLLRMLVDSVIAPIGVAEATYLLALCKHEMAERAQARAEAASPSEKTRLRRQALEDWAIAHDAWSSYEYRSGGVIQPVARLNHAKRLALRAAEMAQHQP